jgi:prepilin-type N-terminal cleavage/methylation domain-containing protein
MTDLRGEEGFTVTELMVAVLLIGVLSAASLGALITIQRTLQGAAQRDAELGQARIAMHTVERQLRSAMRPVGTGLSPFLVADPNEVEFYTAASSPRDTRSEAPRVQGPVPKQVRLWLAGGTLREQVTDPTWDATSSTWIYTATPQPARVLATSIVTPTGGIFTYHCDRADPALTCDGEGEPRTAAIAVSVDMQVRLPAGSDATLLSSRARLVNLEL